MSWPVVSAGHQEGAVHVADHGAGIVRGHRHHTGLLIPLGTPIWVNQVPGTYYSRKRAGRTYSQVHAWPSQSRERRRADIAGVVSEPAGPKSSGGGTDR